MLLRRAVVLGCGPLSELIAEDLSRSRDLSVTLARATDLLDSDGLQALVAPFAVVVSAAPPPLGAATLRAVIAANRLIADASTPVEEALSLEDLAVEMEVAACVGCSSQGLKRLLGTPDTALGAGDVPGDGATIDVNTAALMATALARRLLTGDFRGHWGVWTPARLAARVGMAHGILQDLSERGLASPRR